MTDGMRFHFHPICPWCYITSERVHRLIEPGSADADGAVLSLETVIATDAEQCKSKATRAANGRCAP